MINWLLIYDYMRNLLFNNQITIQKLMVIIKHIVTYINVYRNVLLVDHLVTKKVEIYIHQVNVPGDYDSIYKTQSKIFH